MCGITGIYLSDSQQFRPELLSRLLQLSQTRGKEASGLALRDSGHRRLPEPPTRITGVMSDIVKAFVTDGPNVRFLRPRVGPRYSRR